MRTNAGPYAGGMSNHRCFDIGVTTSVGMRCNLQLLEAITLSMLIVSGHVNHEFGILLGVSNGFRSRFHEDCVLICCGTIENDDERVRCSIFYFLMISRKSDHYLIANKTLWPSKLFFRNVYFV